MIHIAAPAKLNLHLRVLGPRGDGYHSIESLFVRLDLSDDVEIEPAREGIEFSATGEFDVPGDDANLCVVAATSFYAETGLRPSVRIRLTKRIPVAAGLGGGSSDAASVLLGLNRLHGDPLDSTALALIGTGIGSDVPFFLLQTPFALGRGRGEELSALAAPDTRPLLIVVPDFGVSARDAYTWHRETVGTPAIMEQPGYDLATFDLSSWLALARISTNDLAAGVFAHHPALAAASDAIADSGAFMSLLCGSGSCIAGLYETPASRDASLERLRTHPAIQPGWRFISTWSAGPAS